MKKQLGFIGLGIMGGPMALNLSKQFPVVLIYDSDSSKMHRISQKASPSCVRQASIEEIGSTCEVVFLSLPTSEVVEAVVMDQKGLLSFLPKGSVVVDTSTTEVGIVQRIATTLTSKGIHFLDAPVSGGEKAAIEGTLSFMVGGEEAIFEACKPYFQAMGASVVHTGTVGMGQVAKCVNQMIVGATFAVIAESFALGAKAGLNPKVLYEAIKGGWAGSKLLDVAVKDMFSREFKPGGTVDIHWKDLGYSLSLAKGTDVPTPVTALVHEIFKAARAAGDGKRSQPAIVRLWERLLGIEVK
ncbi:MAG: NAD(P)-binding domain-containing protein [Spirochaetales bacterium]